MALAGFSSGWQMGVGSLGRAPQMSKAWRLE